MAKKQSKTAEDMPAKANDLTTDDKYQAENDARTLQSHAEITSDPDRHKAALDHLDNQNQTNRTAARHARRQLRKNVQKGLGSAFPKDDTSPFQKAGAGPEEK